MLESVLNAVLYAVIVVLVYIAFGEIATGVVVVSIVGIGVARWLLARSKPYDEHFEVSTGDFIESIYFDHYFSGEIEHMERTLGPVWRTPRDALIPLRGMPTKYLAGLRTLLTLWLHDYGNIHLTGQYGNRPISWWLARVQEELEERPNLHVQEKV